MSREGKTQKAEFLLSKDGKTLVRFTKIDLTKDHLRGDDGEDHPDGRPVRGNPDAKVTVVNFDDFECPFCARMHTTLMSDIFPEYKDKIKIVYKDFPLVQIHPWAQRAANDANCLAAQSPAGVLAAGRLPAREISAPVGDIQQDVQEALTALDQQTAGVRQEERCRRDQAAGVHQGAVRGNRESFDGRRRQAECQRHADAIHQWREV